MTEAEEEKFLLALFFSGVNDDDKITKCLFKLLKDQSLKYYTVAQYLV